MVSKNKLNSRIKRLFSVWTLFCLFLLACNDTDDNFAGEAYFSIEGNPTGLSADIEGTAKSYVIRSNCPWQIVAQDGGDWVEAFPNEGKDDGIFKFIVNENPTFDVRTMNFAFVVDGEEQPVFFRIDQNANIPYITIPDVEEGVSMLAAGGDVTIEVKSNIEWSYSLSDDSWLSEKKVWDDEIVLTVERNIGEQRTATLTIRSDQYDVSQNIVITQLPGNILLNEDFNWLMYGSIYPYEYKECVRYDSWAQEEKDRGWIVTPNEYSSNQPLCYGSYGYVKLGKTKYGGDLITPKFEIVGTVNLKVTFKSAVYISSGGNVDDRVLKVFALEAGTTSISEFSIDNVPNSKTEDEAGVENDIWADDRAYSFIVTGATSETRIKFLGGDYNLDGVGQGKNRILLDDINIEIIE